MFSRLFYVHLLDDAGRVSMVLIRAMSTAEAIERAARKFPDRELFWVEG
jgi:hypothetical protein